MTRKKLTYVFGPVPSRRLGRSLGVDLVPFKVCTLDCVYCQLGRSTTKTIQRKEYVPLDAVLADIDQALNDGAKPDYITLAGSGEPTLFSRLGELIDRIHERTDVPVDILTNAGLFYDPQVRNEAGKADLIVPSLDAADQQMFEKINRPVDDITFDKFLAGLKTFCNDYGGKVWLEVFFVRDLNDSDAYARKIAGIARDLHVAKVQLNTAVRPTADGNIDPLTPDRMAELAQWFTDPPAEVIASFPESMLDTDAEIEDDSVVDLLKRRPCTLQDIAAGLEVKPAHVGKILERLLRQKRIYPENRQDRLYYRAD